MHTPSLLQLTVVIMAASHAFGAPSDPAQPHRGRDVTFHKVPLVCGAAPEIGCGSKAQPLLAQLEQKNDLVAEAWLNRAGTVVGIVWKGEVSPDARQAVLRSAFQAAGMEALPVADPEQAGLLQSFRGRTGWYRGSDVRQLSLEESRIIAERLVNRVRGRAPLAEDRAQALQAALFEALKDRISKPYAPTAYVESSPESKALREALEARLLEAGRKHLSEADLPALREAVALGLRPLPEDRPQAREGQVKPCCAAKH